MAEIIELEIWKETIKHAFSLNENSSSNLLSTKGTFARLIHYNQGTALLENGFKKNDSIVKSMFEDPPTGYPDEISRWQDALDISDAQYFENLNYITQNSIPLLNQLNISDQSRLSLAKVGLDIFNEQQLIKERNPDIFNKEIFDDLSGEIITQSKSVDYGNHLKGLYRKDVRGYDSNLLWGISERRQREQEKEALLSIDPEFRILELNKTDNRDLTLIDELENTYKDIDGYQNLILRGNKLYQNNDLSNDDKLDRLLDSAYIYDAQNETAFGSMIEDNMHDSDVETIDSAMELSDGQEKIDFDYQKLIDKGYEYVNIEKNDSITNSDLKNTLNRFIDDKRFDFKEKITSRLNELYVNNPNSFKRYANEENLTLKNKNYELNGNLLAEKDFGNIVRKLDLKIKYEREIRNMEFENHDNTTPLGVMNQIDSNLKPLLEKENISKDQFESDINLLKEKNELSDDQVPFDKVYSELLVEEGIRIKDDKYLAEYQIGSRELNDKEYSKLLKDVNWELEAYKSDREFKKMNPEKETIYSDKEKLYQESLKELENPEVKQDFRVAAAIIKRESGSFDMINPFDSLTADKELATVMSNFKMDKLLKDPTKPYDLKSDFPNYGDTTNALMKNEMQTYLDNRDVEVKKYIPKDELVKYEYQRSQERQNYRIFGTTESRGYDSKIDDLNLAGVDELSKTFSSNESFENHLTKYGHLYSEYGAVNALVISNQIDKKISNNPKFSGDSANIAIRKDWVDKDMYPKNSDAIGFVFVPNKEGKISNNPKFSDVNIARFYTSDSFKNYGKDHKDKSKLAAYKQRSSMPEYGVKDTVKEIAYKESLKKVYKDTEIKDPIVKLGMEYSVQKALGIAKEPFKLPREFDIKEINDPKDQLTRLNQIHKHSMRVLGLSKSGIQYLKEKLVKNNNKNQSKQPEQNKNVKSHTHKR